MEIVYVIGMLILLRIGYEMDFLYFFGGILGIAIIGHRLWTIEKAINNKEQLYTIELKKEEENKNE